MSTTVSIIIANYNYGQYLAEAIESALAQSWPHCEVVFIDDGSSDDSIAIASRYPITVLKQAPDSALVKSGFSMEVKIEKRADSSGRRSALAKWLTQPNHPLTTRVIVNRVWQYHFGRGIVATASDYGRLGEKPTHPESLDYLARDFVKNGWSIKKLHRLILTSNAYRMSSRPDPSALARDPENDLFWRFNPRRLSAEELRDSILAVSGNLNLKMGGPSIHPTIPKEVLAGQSIPGNGWDLKCPPEERARRSVYVHIKRSLLVPILAQFDHADTDASCPVRFTTTVPTQALGLLNDAFSNEQAGTFARRLRREASDGLEAQVTRSAHIPSGCGACEYTIETRGGSRPATRDFQP